MNNYFLNRLFCQLKFSVYRPHREGHGIHSPFLFDYITNVINNKATNPQIENILNLRLQLLRDNSILEVEDMGAGSALHRNPERKVKDIACNSSTSPKYGKLLHHTAAYFQPKNILELGTCLGLGTAFLATACPTAKVITLEGSNQLQEQARKNFDFLNINNITSILGNFKDTLPQVVKQDRGLDLVYIDGNHRKEATIAYFQTLLPFIKSSSVVIFDDIRWSEEMFEAWQEISQNKRVRQSIDLFQMGIIFFNEKLQKQHFQIYY